MESDQSYEIGSRLKSLENERNKLLMVEEERWRLKSKATWIKSGDKNNKYFHKFASYRRNKNHLWEVKDESGLAHYGHDAIKIEAQRYFSTFYQESIINTIEDQVSSVRYYPRMVNEEEVIHLEKLVTKEKLLEVLKGFAKDKSHGPDGRTIEFYLHFYDMVAKDLLDAVEESRQSGEVNKALNLNFIALIPKVNGPATFEEFRSITLCNIFYKIISKIIAKRIKPILSRALSEEQFGFLKVLATILVLGPRASRATGCTKNAQA